MVGLSIGDRMCDRHAVTTPLPSQPYANQNRRRYRTRP